VYQKVPRLVPQTANGLHYVNACAMLESGERRHSVCQVASLCEHWELHSTRTGWRRSSGNRRMLLARFENRTSNTRSSSGNGAGIDVSMHKGTILKGILPKLKSSKYILVYRSSLGTFWYTHVHVHTCTYTLCVLQQVSEQTLITFFGSIFPSVFVVETHYVFFEVGIKYLIFT
jgi:hypothetical protein